ncbi:MAG: hypothetical protein ACTTKN_01675 [Phocaeicola sp.]|uniref:hypothetical protein n=1 Tax=Phocaeicola sp. TaxID=2773926 RepID=UPI003F9FAB51
METYDILFKDSREETAKGFNIKDKDKAIRMASDMLAKKKGLVLQYSGGTINVINKQSHEVLWSESIPKE